MTTADVNITRLQLNITASGEETVIYMLIIIAAFAHMHLLLQDVLSNDNIQGNHQRFYGEG